MAKNKIKKIIAGIGIGCIVMSSGALMAGCSLELTEEQENKIQTVIDNSNQFMDSTMDILQDSVSKIDRDMAVKLYEKSVARLMVNYNNVWDNVAFSIENKFYDAGSDGYQYQETKIIGMENGNKYCLEYGDSNGDNVVELQSISDNIQESGEMSSGSFSSLTKSRFEQLLNVGEVTIETIVDWKVLENGNYAISAVGMGDLGDGQGQQLLIVDCEISNDAFLISKSYSYVVVSSEISSSAISTIKFEYGTLNEAEIQSEIDNFRQSH